MAFVRGSFGRPRVPTSRIETEQRAWLSLRRHWVVAKRCWVRWATGRPLNDCPLRTARIFRTHDHGRNVVAGFAAERHVEQRIASDPANAWQQCLLDRHFTDLIA